MFTLGIFKERNRSLIYYIARYFGYHNSIKPLLIPEDINFGPCEIRLTATNVSDGSISLFELVTISQLCKYYNPSAIFEIGTFDGRTTLNLSLNAVQNCKIYTLDLPEKDLKTTKFKLAEYEDNYVNKPHSGYYFQTNPEIKNIYQLYGDSATFDYSPFMNSIDFVFIDGSHAYDYVKSDTEKAISMLKNNKGMIVWHDYGIWNGVTRFINEQYSTNTMFRNIKWIENTSIVYLELK
ncbi:MAG: class I SAM-dependent methyltransferase [Bacteroidia bacterium]